jgi:predicted O-methyltransferase YrrM
MRDMAGRETWAAVDEYVTGLLSPDDEQLAAAVAAAGAAGLPAIQVSPPQGKLLYLLAKTIGARRALEFGTLGGYSAIWLARALPDGGLLTTLEADPKHAQVATASIERAGLADRVDLRIGPALEALPQLAEEGAGPFDLVFIDADKANTPAYFEWSLERTRPGGLIVADNVIRDGALIDESNEEPAIAAQRRFHEMLAAEPRVEATTIQTVGVKGYDGFSLMLVK